MNLDRKEKLFELLSDCSSSEVLDLLIEYISKELAEPAKAEESTPCLSAFISFSAEEIKLMPKNFRTIFRRDGHVAYVKKYFIGGGVYYEIRYLRHGYKVVVVGNELKVLKREFIEQVNKLYD